MKTALLAAIAVVILVSCAAVQDRQKIQDGLLTMGLRQSAFLEEWGKPDRTHVTSGQEIMRAGWSGGGGSFFRGKETFEVWVYEKRKTELVFNRRKTLAGWQTDATVRELASPPK